MGHKTAGYTLIELVVVMLVIGIWSTIALPRIGHSLNRHRMDALVQRLESDFKQAQRRAINTSQSVVITFDTVSHTYTIQSTSALDASHQPYTIKLSEYNAKFSMLWFGGDQKIVYDGYGEPDGFGWFVVDIGPFQKTVFVYENTGIVEVY